MGVLFPLEAGTGEIPRGLSQLWDPFLVLLEGLGGIQDLPAWKR